MKTSQLVLQKTLEEEREKFAQLLQEEWKASKELQFALEEEKCRNFQLLAKEEVLSVTNCLRRRKTEIFPVVDWERKKFSQLQKVL